LEFGADPRDRRLVRNRRERVRLGMRRLRRIVSKRAADAEQLLGLAVPGLELLIGKGPGGGDAAEMLQLHKILAAVADEHSSVKLRIAADEVVVSRVESLAAGLAPELLRPEVPATEDRR